MSELKSPVQPFIVRHKGSISSLQMQSLFQLYQPIIGAQAINFYLLLMQQPVNDKKMSNQKVHSSLFPYFSGGLKAIDEARLNLEAIGLIQTYKQTDVSLQSRYATLLYDMQSPLLLTDFLDSPVLSNALINQIGDVEFYEIIKQWEIAPIEIAEYEEVSVSYSTVFSHPHNDYQTLVQDVKKDRQFVEEEGNRPDPVAVETFDYGRLMRKLIENKISHQLIGPKLKEELQGIHIVYGLNEEQLFQLVMKNYHRQEQAINYQAIKLDAKNLAQNTNIMVTTKAMNVEGNQKKSQTDNNHSISLEQIQKDYPQLSKADIALVQLCHQYQPEAVLTQIKKDRNGFVSTQELNYIKNIADISKLSVPVQSFLVYYLLNIKKRTDFQKGESERVANEWQQSNIESVPQALIYVRQQAKAIALRQKQRDNARQGAKNQYRQTNQKVEQQPYWIKKSQPAEKTNLSSLNDGQSSSNPKTGMQTEQTAEPRSNGQSSQSFENHSTKHSEEQLRSRLGKLFEKGRE